MSDEKEQPGAENKTPADDGSSSDVASSSISSELPTPTHQSIWSTVIAALSYTPKRCRWNPDKPPEFTIWLNLLFAFSAAFTVANLYYNHPILNILAHEFNVPYETASRIPTLMQAGYAGGLLFLCPLGDLFKRRPYTILLVWITATFWIGLCVTKSFTVFLTLSFLTGFTTVTPQIMLPLVGDLAPPTRRALALSIVVSGNLLGMLVARLFSGVLTNYTSWRNIYWFAFGMNYLITILLWLFMPDYPSTNPGGLNYFKMLWDVFALLTKYPVLAQACLIAYCMSQSFTSFWTTLTFLLSGPPYNYSPLIIGLFALIGIASMCVGPPLARAIIDRFVPLFSVILGVIICLLGVTVGTYTGRMSVAGPIIQAFFTDMGLQTAQTANRSAIYAVAPKARNRVNTTFMVAVFAGQLTGTAAGNHLYARGGWIASGSLSVGMLALSLFFCVVRGPWENGWVGWSGGWSFVKQNPNSANGRHSGGENDIINKETTGEGSTQDAASATAGTVATAAGAEAGAADVDVEKALSTTGSGPSDTLHVPQEAR